jgi:hypothetical protein
MQSGFFLEREATFSQETNRSRSSGLTEGARVFPVWDDRIENKPVRPGRGFHQNRFRPFHCLWINGIIHVIAAAAQRGDERPVTHFASSTFGTFTREGQDHVNASAFLRFGSRVFARLVVGRRNPRGFSFMSMRRAQ